MRADLRVLIAAAGTGSRAGLPYPKTLHPVLGKPILLRQLELFSAIDPRPVVIVSPTGAAPIAAALAGQNLDAELIVQAEPTGMGDAILAFREAERAESTEHLVIVWGDLPLLQQATVEAVCERHFAQDNDFTFATRVVDEAYTRVERDAAGAVTSLIETRETGEEPGPGERDIGLFVVRTRPVFDLLAQRLPGASGKKTHEHGFLYIVAHLANRGLKVEALPVATELDLVSLNHLSDLDVLVAR